MGLNKPNSNDPVDMRPCTLCESPEGLPRIGGPAPSVCVNCARIVVKWDECKEQQRMRWYNGVLGFETVPGDIGDIIRDLEIASSSLRAIAHNIDVEKRIEQESRKKKT